MSFDGVMMRAIRNELGNFIVGSRVDRVDQPSKYEVMLTLRSPREKRLLFISSIDGLARIHLSQIPKERPAEPPAFCMLLRKHLEGGEIMEVSQEDTDRILRITISSPLEEERKPTVIVAELTGKHSNIILLDRNSSTILGAIKPTPPQVETRRLILPGEPYTSLPVASKLDPTTADENDFWDALEEGRETGIRSPKEFLLKTYQGFGPTICREICHRASISADARLSGLCREDGVRLFLALAEIISIVKDANFIPTLYTNDETGEIIDFSWTELRMFRSMETISRKDFPSFGELLDYVFGRLDEEKEIENLRATLARVVRENLARVEKKIEAREESLRKSEKAEDYRIAGELILANLHAIPAGAEEVTLPNYYDPQGAPVTIKLDPRVAPARCAQSYFNQYRKAKNGMEVTSKLLDEAKEERDYLEQVSLTISEADSREVLEEIKQELIDSEYIRPRRHSGHSKSDRMRAPRNKGEMADPLEFQAPDGTRILVGRNNVQNDRLTMKIARPDDIWLHAHQIPGAHVIVIADDRGEVSEEALLMGARLAARFSKAKMSEKVPVDFTKRRFVKKPKSARPGMVIYRNENTILVEPLEQ